MKQLYTHISLELGLRIFGMVSIWKSLYHTAAREVEGEHLEKMNLKKKVISFIWEKYCSSLPVK